MNFPIKKVYIIHYTKLKERKDYIRRLLENFCINHEFIERYDRENISEETLKMYDSSESVWNQKMGSLWKKESYRILKMSEISCTLKHIEAIKKTAESNQISLIFEDDIQMVDRFTYDFARFYEELCLHNWDAAFIGGGAGLRIKQKFIKNNQFCYKVGHPASRCADSYLMTPDAAKKILTSILPFSLPYDFELAYQFWKHSMNVFWAEPIMIGQGSETGAYKSSIR